MKGYLKALVGLLILFSTPVSSGEVTDKEWNVGGGFLAVTYYHEAANKVKCTAFNQQGKPIGGGSAYPEGGVARVIIPVPEKYVETELKVSCKKTIRNVLMKTFCSPKDDLTTYVLVHSNPIASNQSQSD